MFSRGSLLRKKLERALDSFQGLQIGICDRKPEEQFHPHPHPSGDLWVIFTGLWQGYTGLYGLHHGKFYILKNSPYTNTTHSIQISNNFKRATKTTANMIGLK